MIYEVANATTRSLQSGPLYAVQWSPTGDRIAFVAPTATGSTALFLYDVASGGTTQVTDASISPAIPRWSPDGKQIAFLGIPGGYDYGPCL